MTHILAWGGTLHGQLRCIQDSTPSQPTPVNLPTIAYLTLPEICQNKKFEEKLNQADKWTVWKV